MQLLNDAKNFKNLGKNDKINLISFLIALSSILSIIDYLIPKPIPFIKIGLANIISVILITENLFSLAFIIGLLRCVFSSIILGTLFSMSFYLSLSGAFFSLILSILFKNLLKENISDIGISVIGAEFNMIGQFIILCVFFKYDKSLFLLMNFLLIISVILGVIVGIISKKLKNHIYKKN